MPNKTDWKPSKHWFPHLDAEGWSKSSDEDGRYNCIAWAAGESHRQWWPSPSTEIYWPDDGGEPTIEVFQRAFQTLGYKVCLKRSTEVEDGVEKVAIYADERGEVQHMSRQLPTGKWASKMGFSAQDPDIEHNTAAGVRGPSYGQLVCIMRRPKAPVA